MRAPVVKGKRRRDSKKGEREGDWEETLGSEVVEFA